jgi:pSer/pThr/pTyr-binding forkhead associated (FHA) protein
VVAPPPAPDVTPTVNDGRPLDQGWFAVLDDGRDVPITGLVMLGRNPQARAGEDDAELIKVADDTRTVSKTHLSLRVDANGLFVMDRGSTNGTTLTNVVGISKPCPAGDIVSVSEGAIVSFGDHWLRIERRFDR